MAPQKQRVAIEVIVSILSWIIFALLTVNNLTGVIISAAIGLVWGIALSTSKSKSDTQPREVSKPSQIVAMVTTLPIFFLMISIGLGKPSDRREAEIRGVIFVVGIIVLGILTKAWNIDKVIRITMGYALAGSWLAAGLSSDSDLMKWIGALGGVILGAILQVVDGVLLTRLASQKENSNKR